MKKNYKTYAFLILLIIAVLAIMDGLTNSNEAEELRKEKDQLAEEAASFKNEYEIKASRLDVAIKENKALEESLSELEKEIESLRSAVEYKEFAAAVREVDTYKAVQTFEEANRFIALKDGVGSYTNDSEGNCPCGFFFEKGFEWVPNAALDLKASELKMIKSSLPIIRQRILNRIINLLWLRRKDDLTERKSGELMKSSWWARETSREAGGKKKGS
ncbi:hypothetical protein [Cytobacillus sp. SAFR-174]|uniref:hypothetical protein n=1 Tax=Cytobacillus sp. SAFR-174 TaxID=3436868 RepID=UPI003F7E4865